MSDAKGLRNFRLNVLSDGTTGITIYDANGRSRLILNIDSSGGSSALIRNSKGKIVKTELF